MDFEVNGIMYYVHDDGKMAMVADIKKEGEVIIPSSVTYKGTEYQVTMILILGRLFSSCIGLTRIVIPKSVTRIHKRAFSACHMLESIVVEKGNPKYDSRDNCNAIIETNTNELIIGCKNTIIPNSVTEIGMSAFEGCSGLKSDALKN